jgi:hypothetical protein
VAAPRRCRDPRATPSPPAAPPRQTRPLPGMSPTWSPATRPPSPRYALARLIEPGTPHPRSGERKRATMTRRRTDRTVRPSRKRMRAPRSRGLQRIASRRRRASRDTMSLARRGSRTRRRARASSRRRLTHRTAPDLTRLCLRRCRSLDQRRRFGDQSVAHRDANRVVAADDPDFSAARSSLSVSQQHSPTLAA